MQDVFWPVLGLAAWAFAVLGEWAALKEKGLHRLAASLALLAVSTAVTLAVLHLPRVMLASALPIIALAVIQWLLAASRGHPGLMRAVVMLVCLAAAGLIFLVPAPLAPVVRYAAIGALLGVGLSAWWSEEQIAVGGQALAAARGIAFTAAMLLPLATWAGDGLLAEMLRWENLALLAMAWACCHSRVHLNGAPSSTAGFNTATPAPARLAVRCVLLALGAAAIGGLVLHGPARVVAWGAGGGQLLLGLGLLGARRAAFPAWLRAALPDLPMLALGAAALLIK